MKRAIAQSVLGLLAVLPDAGGEGHVQFSNYYAAPYNPILWDANVPDVGGHPVTVGADGLTLQVWYGEGVITDPTQLAPGATTHINPLLSYNGGGWYDPVLQVLPDWDPGDTYTFQLRASGNVDGSGSIYGESVLWEERARIVSTAYSPRFSDQSIALTVFLNDQEPQLWRGLVAHYTFDNADATDATGNGHDGLVNGATWDGAGVLGGAFAFDGVNDVIRIPDHPALNPETFTLVQWVRLADHDVSRGVFAKRRALATTSYKVAIHPDAQLGFSVHAEGVDLDPVEVWFGDQVGRWTMVAATYNGTNARVYLDGQLAGEMPAVAGALSNGEDILIGAGGFAESGDLPSDPFRGLIDEVRVYSRELSEAEVAWLYEDMLTEERAPAIVLQPQGQTVRAGESATFTVGATSSEELTFAWSKNGVPIAEATNATLTLPVVAMEDEGWYRGSVSNALGTATSSEARLAVLDYDQHPLTNLLNNISIVALLPDPTRPYVYGLQRGRDGTNASLLAFDALSGATLRQLPVPADPTDFAIDEIGDLLYIIHFAQPLISRVQLSSFIVDQSKAFPQPDNDPLADHYNIAAGPFNKVYFSDGRRVARINIYDFQLGELVASWHDNRGVGDLAVTRDGRFLYRWQQVGWIDDNPWSTLKRWVVEPDNLIIPREDSIGFARDPLDTPVLLDREEDRVFCKHHAFAADDVRERLATFAEDIYAISPSGDVAFGHNGVFSALNEAEIARFAATSTVQTVSSDGARLFRYLDGPNRIEVHTVRLLVGGELESNRRPQPSFTRSPDPATTLNLIAFDASTTTDDIDAVHELRYRWDWDDDGEFDTVFTNETVAVHRYNVGGTKTVTLQVKDRFGAVAGITQRFVVAVEEDFGVPGEGNPAYAVEFEAADLAFDPNRPYAYLSHYDGRKLVVMNLTNGLVHREFLFDWMPEAITVSPNGQRMYVALLRRPHRTYGTDPHLNYIAEFDLARTVKLKEFEVSADPFDLAATDNGLLFMSGGSDQWTDLQIYRVATGEQVDSYDQVIRYQCGVVLHPNQQTVYTSPQWMHHLEVDPLTGMFVQPSTWWESYTHGSGNKLWAHPDGQHLILQHGGIVTTSPDQASDLVYEGELTAGGVEGLFFDPTHDALLAVGEGGLSHYAPETFLLHSSRLLDLHGDHVHAYGELAYVAGSSDGHTHFQRFAHPAVLEPVIIEQPRDAIVDVGDHASLTIMADSALELSYQWYHDGEPLSESDSPVLEIQHSGEDDQGAYHCLVQNLNGARLSSMANLVVNQFPIADASATLSAVISRNGTNASVVLDGTRSSDPDGDPLTLTWFEEGQDTALASGLVASVDMTMGTHTIQLEVNDGRLLAADTVLIRVVTPGEALDLILLAVQDSTAGNGSGLEAILSAAIASIGRGNAHAAVNQLRAFQNKVLAQVAPYDPELAGQLDDQAERIIDVLLGAERGGAGAGRLRAYKEGGLLKINIPASTARVYIIEASTDLVDWEPICVVRPDTEGNCDYEDVVSDKYPCRFYRVVERQ